MPDEDNVDDEDASEEGGEDVGASLPWLCQPPAGYEQSKSFFVDRGQVRKSEHFENQTFRIHAWPAIQQ